MATVYKRGRVWWAAGVDRFGERWQRSTKQTVEADAKLVAAELEEELANDAHRSKDEACTLESVLDELITFSEASGRSEARCPRRCLLPGANSRSDLSSHEGGTP